MHTFAAIMLVAVLVAILSSRLQHTPSQNKMSLVGLVVSVILFIYGFMLYLGQSSEP